MQAKGKGWRREWGRRAARPPYEQMQAKGKGRVAKKPGAAAPG
jgi:hypothetical protein